MALEFAQFFARFDVEVTVLRRSANVLQDFDDDAGPRWRRLPRRRHRRPHRLHAHGRPCRGADKVIVYEQAGKTCEEVAEAVFTGLAARRTPGRSRSNAGVETERAALSAMRK